ncbi:MAG: hypothetical protein ACKVJK_15370, partial [Methylophagaceae bacterium]
MFNKVTGVIIFSGLALFSAIAQSSTFQNPIEGELYSEKDDPEVYCMAINIYHEARADNLA